MDAALAEPGQFQRHSRIGRWLVAGALLLLATDFIYRTLNQITYATRDKCILYRALPKPLFLAYEYFVELGAMVLVGIFFARLLAGWFARYKAWYPKTPFTAFLYGSLLPVCACAAIPITQTMRGRLTTRTTIAFVLAAPLLSPYILVLSFGLLGWRYGLLRVGTSCLLAVTAGYAVEWLGGVRRTESEVPLTACGKSRCPLAPSDVCADTYAIFRSVLPWLLAAGVLGLVLELLAPVHWLEGLKSTSTLLRTGAAIGVGVPLYLCNGTEVLLLRPLLHQGGITLGTAVAFSLSSTAICTTSIVMLFKFIGTRATVVLLAHIVVGTFLMAWLIDMLT